MAVNDQSRQQLHIASAPLLRHRYSLSGTCIVEGSKGVLVNTWILRVDLSTTAYIQFIQRTISKAHNPIYEFLHRSFTLATSIEILLAVFSMT